MGASLPFRPSFVASGFVELPIHERISTVVRGTAVGKQTVLTERFSGQRADIEEYFLLGVTFRYRAAAWADLPLPPGREPPRRGLRNGLRPAGHSGVAAGVRINR